MSQITQQEMRTPVPFKGDGRHPLPPSLLPTAPDLIQEDHHSCLDRLRIPFDSLHPSLAPENGRAGETGWETGWNYCLPSQPSARRMCTSIASFPLKRPGDNQVDGELSLLLCVSNEVGTKIEDREGRKEGWFTLNDPGG